VENMAKQRKLSVEHKKKISESMKKRHATMKKGVASGDFGAQSAEYNMTAAGLRSLSKNIGPDQAYQLSIDVRSAISAIANNIGKMQIRLYNARSGKEIVGGDVYDFFKRPAPRYTQSRWLAELASYYSLVNEIALLRDPGSAQPRFLMPLNPSRLDIHDPTIVRDLSQINQWRYSWEDGMLAYYNSDQVCFDKAFNPTSNVRGVSPILTGANEVGGSYEAGRYNKTFFENGAVPSHMLVLPEGTPRQTRLDIEQRYLATFGLGEGNGHKVMVVSGGDVKLQELSQKVKDAEFTNLISMNTQRIAQLFKVPAIEMGIYDKTRFETAATEREMFYEGTLMPLANRIGDFLQDQVVDRWFSSSTVKTADTRVSKNLGEAIEKASQRSMSDIVVVLDAETTPIAAKIMRDRIQATAELRTSAGLSFNEAAEYVGLELPDPKNEPDNYRDMVFINSSEQRIDNMLNDSEPIVPEVTVPSVSTEQTEEEVEVPVEADKALVKKLNDFLRKYRKVAVKAADATDMYRLAEVDKLIDEELEGCPLMKHQARVDYATINGFIKEGNKRSVKDTFNSKDRGWIKSFAIKIENNKGK
jgi:HK97 family phage portal protein